MQNSSSGQTRVRFWWLPNAITAVRALLSVPIVVASVQHAWTVAFWLFVIALISDFFDGLAARKLGAHSKFGEEFDAATDALLVAAGMLGLAFAGVLPLWFAMGVLAVGGLIGSERHLPRGWRPHPAVGKIMAVSCLFIAWTGIAWTLAAKAYGWSWWYVPIALLMLLVCGVLKRNRVRSWLRGE